MKRKNKVISFYDELSSLGVENKIIFFSFMSLEDTLKGYIYKKYGNGIDNEPTSNKLTREDQIKYFTALNKLIQITAENAQLKVTVFSRKK